MDAWAYQKSFPEGSNIREWLLHKIVGWRVCSVLNRLPVHGIQLMQTKPRQRHRNKNLVTNLNRAFVSRFSTTCIHPSLLHYRSCLDSTDICSVQGMHAEVVRRRIRGLHCLIFLGPMDDYPDCQWAPRLAAEVWNYTFDSLGKCYGLFTLTDANSFSSARTKSRGRRRWV